MSIQEFVHRESIGSRYAKIPFIMAMVDSNGTLHDLNYPPQEGFTSNDKILGVELMINPRTISNNQAKIINRSQTMTSFVEEHWGDEMDTLSFQGQTATFVTGGNDLYSIRNTAGSPTQEFLKSKGRSDPKLQARSLLFNFAGARAENDASPSLGAAAGSRFNASDGMGVNDNEIGLTVSKRRQSVSYRQFKRMVDLIRANGCFYDAMGIISRRYFIQLSYSTMAFKGYFENIDITEDANNPYKFTFTVTFKAQETIFSYVDRNISENVVAAPILSLNTNVASSGADIG